LSFYSVHTPLISRQDLRAKYAAKAQRFLFSGARFLPEAYREARQVQDHAVYGGMVEAMDLAVGKVLRGLQRLELSGHTIIFLMSDNGGLSTSEGSPTSNAPLRGGKGWMYEGGIREPMIVRAPGVTRAGSACDSPVTSTDFFPTILELTGLPLQPANHIDGQSMLPLLKGGQAARGPIFWHYPHYGNQGGAPTGAVREGPWKLIEWYEDGHLQLFNVDKDISERYNLAATYPRKTKELHQKLR
ncbi:MAG: sulfatase-like hydrolase/transferase, partial [bacterium]|nr:sulfatase-like hydrolase/transferase [bacterium]